MVTCVCDGFLYAYDSMPPPPPPPLFPHSLLPPNRVQIQPSPVDMFNWKSATQNPKVQQLFANERYVLGFSRLFACVFASFIHSTSAAAWVPIHAACAECVAHTHVGEEGAP